MTKYAIVNADTKEFYADPIYTEWEKAVKKVKYLLDYRKEHKMKPTAYKIEKLTPEREAQHDKEWQSFVMAID